MVVPITPAVIRRPTTSPVVPGIDVVRTRREIELRPRQTLTVLNRDGRPLVVEILEEVPIRSKTATTRHYLFRAVGDTARTQTVERSAIDQPARASETTRARQAADAARDLAWPAADYSINPEKWSTQQLAPTAVFRICDLPWKRQITYLWREHTIVPFTRAWPTDAPEPPTTYDILTGTWTLTTTVPLGSACPQNLLCSMYEPAFPRSQAKATNPWTMTIRQQLTETHGALCALCQVHIAEVIDHDHITGMVRGYLCNRCNGFVDRCTHSNDCPVSEYLNNPPARELAILYGDNTKKKLQRRSQRFRRLLQLVDALGISSP